LVVSSKALQGAALVKTSAAVKLLGALGADADLSRVKKSKKMRAGKGKMRGRRFRQRRGPLIVYNPETDGKEFQRAFRNIAGVETCSVLALNLLQLAPGGHLGRFIIWTSGAFAALDEVYGSTTEPSEHKKDWLLPSNVVSNADITRLINSSEIQSVVRPKKGDKITKRPFTQKKNPLRNKLVMLRLNPYAKAFAQQGSPKYEKGKKADKAGAVFAETLKEE
jgi:large subunit ribosomal protein L4e